MYPLFLPRSAAALLLALSSTAGAAIDAGPVPPSGWTIGQKPASIQLTGFEESEDLSGIATMDGIHVMVGSDELIASQLGTLDPATKTITAGTLVPLLQNPSGKKMEIDIEGIAASPADHCYFVTGSHGVGKKKGEFDPSRATVFKIPCDPATGEPIPDSIQKSSLLPWLEKSEAFRDYLAKPLQLNGLNIEGLTFHDGKLYFGLRGPNVLGDTYIIESAADTFFNGSTPECRLHTLPVGQTRGIRELAAIRDGFIIITGNASAEATKKFPTSQARSADKVFDVLLWQPEKTPALTSIGVLPAPAAKAEAILVLEDAPKYVDILVLFDGASQGGAQTYRLTRP